MKPIEGFVACICEGAAERTIINILLENRLLCFRKDQLIDGRTIQCRKAKNFEEEYLSRGFSEKITVFRILDSHREDFKLSALYQQKVKVLNVITAPEIEMLIIHKLGKYSAYQKSGKKPSVYCKELLKTRSIKSEDFMRKFFSDVDQLVVAIHEHKSKSKQKKDELFLADLLISE